VERVLAFGCHPDDVEFQCAGTLALLAEKGYEVHIATMTGGELGSANLSPQQIREKRLGECAISASVIGAHCHHAGASDVEVEYSAELRRQTIRIVREVDPVIVFTHPPMDYMIDHEETSRLVRNAVFVATVPNYDCGAPTTPTRRIPHLYYWDAFGGVDVFGRPLPINRVVNISSVLQTKKKMLEGHVSQREWLAHVSGMDNYVDEMAKNAERQGRAIGVDAAEGFVQHLGANYPLDNVLKQMLGDLTVEV
jgi:N-acetylglucosamine malate deacetylase 1